MTITPAFCPLSLQVVLDSNGVPIPGATLSFFDAGTTTPRNSYSDAALSLNQQAQVSTDAYGRLPAMFLGVGAYGMILRDAAGAQISAADAIPGGIEDDQAVAPIGTVIPTGFVLPAHTDDVFDGWLPLNGQTIGNATSSGTARASADVKALFTTLWNKDTSLIVLGGRGLTATADWSAGKTIALPDYRGRSVAGVDGMGGPLAGVLTALSTTTPDTIGTKIGSEGVSLTVDQLATHHHTATIGPAGGHSHTGSTDANGAHTHNGTTDNAGGHTHGYFDTTGQLAGSGGSGQAWAPPPRTSQTTLAGDHNHTFSVGGGQHGHALNVDAVGDHTHTITETDIGSGAKHANVQPSVLVFWHIKL